jgi:signal transduction histidine kinase
MTSLKRQLIYGMVILQTVVGLLTAGISFVLSRNEANALLDHQLVLIARSIDEGSQLPIMQAKFIRESEEDRANDFVIQVWMNGAPMRASRPNFDLPRAPASGFSVLLRPGQTRHVHWRAYTLYHSDRVVQVSQSENVRNDIAIRSVLRALLPGVALIPLSWLLIGLLVGRVLQPLKSVMLAARQRSLDSLEPLPTGQVPLEIVPLTDAINALISRLSHALAAQRQFLADAAHALRTPLAALQLQIDSLPHSPNGEELQRRLLDMRRGVQRSGRLVAQLLRIARYEAQSSSLVSVPRPVPLNDLIKTLIAEFIPIAGQKSIDLGLVQDDAVSLLSHEDDLQVLFGNLLDNAIRYTPAGGRVDVRIARVGECAEVSVCDTGQGIPTELMERVFDRFFRAAGEETEGSGIGLAIVKSIVERESAHIVLENREQGGLLVMVRFCAVCAV